MPAARDPLASPRRWFAVLPGPAPAWTDGNAPDPGITVIEGMAVLSTDLLSLPDVREAIVGRLPAGADVTLYPVDD